MPWLFCDLRAAIITLIKERVLSHGSGRPSLSEKGLLTPGNCVATFIDLQPRMLFRVGDFDRQSIVPLNVLLVGATRVFDIPVVLSTVKSKSFSGSLLLRMRAVVPDQVPIERATMKPGTIPTSGRRSSGPDGERSCWWDYGPAPVSRGR
jgi:hypothetical protein